MSRGTRAGGDDSGRYLLVLGDDSMITHALPAEGEVVLGRDGDCDVPLAHEKISRRHVRLHLGVDVVVEDLGSTNGVKLAGRKLGKGERAPLPIGESLRIGPYTAIVLAGSPDGSMSHSDDGVPRAAVTVRDPTIDGASELLRRVAKHGVNILISGETGTGKEVLARTIHVLSGRTGELVAINCAALTGPLLESELFGHEQGAFTGATRAKPGLLEIAGSGTAMLDEVGDLPLELQGKLLRALEARQVYRVGGVKPIDLSLRLIAATHRNLPDDVAAGRFRQDLYFRLNGITLEIPPLRERRSQIPGLALRFLAEASKSAGIAAPTFTARAQAALASHDWPGNVRELRLVIERALLLANGAEIDAKHILLSPARSTPSALAADGVVDERARFVEVAKAQRGNVSAIGRELGTSRSQVRRLATRFGIDLDSLKNAR
ncbi:MAG TPA: sigma 54-interacting transcriptional regulator [Kofleriaceae bacterium]|nr:sigma 54-interacting transcriptional regulator [Kofleriaceae bacterium]